MSINIQPATSVDSTGAVLTPAVSVTGQTQVADDVLRRIQEIILLHQQANLLSTQLANDKTGKYNFMEIR